MSQYDPQGDLRLYHLVGTAEVSSVTDDFAVLEDVGPMTAQQHQTMADGGWHLMYPPQVTMGEQPMHVYTFQRQNFGL